jgi:hypothetical protein
MTGGGRAELTLRFDNELFGSVHPDDVEILAKLGYEFATKESPYDVIYRTRLFGCGDYHSIHAVGSYQTMETGCHVAFIVYTDITNTAAAPVACGIPDRITEKAGFSTKRRARWPLFRVQTSAFSTYKQGAAAPAAAAGFVTTAELPLTVFLR